MNKTLRIATRRSPLALWQAEHIRTAILARHTDLDIELLPMTTRGDKILDAPLAKVGGKGLFVKELEAALLEGRADIAVHSTKDVPMSLPAGLELGVICLRENPHDALVLPALQVGSSEQRVSTALLDLPQGARIGTSSLRRKVQLLRARPDFVICDLRGNVNSRLAKLDAGDYDAIVLAASGLQRLDLASRISAIIDASTLLPAVGQGALSIESRSGDADTRALLAHLHDPDSARCVLAERAMNRRLNGGCQVPIAGYATSSGDRISLEGRVGAIDGSQLLVARASGQDADHLGVQVAEDLLAQGAGQLLSAAYDA